MISLDVRRGASRYRSEHDGVVSWHGFSAGAFYEPDNLGFGSLVAFDEHVLAPGSGFAAHRHREVEILTWPVAGVLTHRHADEVAAVVPGSLQYLAAGAGVTHSETNEAAAPARFLQMSLPTLAGSAMRWEHAPIVDGPGSWLPLASAAETAAVRLLTPGADLFLARLAAGEHLALPPGPMRLLHVVRGQVCLDAPAAALARLGPGDSVRMTGPRAVAGQASESAELLLWRFDR